MDDESHEHHAHPHAKHKMRKEFSHMKQKKKPIGKYVLGAVVFVVLVAVVVGLIWLTTRSGESRLAKQSEIAATVNNETITTTYLDEQYSRVPEMYKAYITKSALLNQTINEVLLLQEAKKKKIAVSTEDVEVEITTAMEKAGVTEDQLDERLKAQNITREYLTDLYSKQLTINKLLEKSVFAKLNVSDEEIAEFYDSRIHAMHILVANKSDAVAIIKTLSKSSASKLESDFAKLAKEKSTDPSAETNGGDLGEFGEGQMVAEFEQAAFALEENELVSEPVKTQFGYHVILRLPKNETLEEQSASISEVLLNQKKAKAVPLYIDQLKSKANVQVLYEEPASAVKSE